MKRFLSMTLASLMIFGTTSVFAQQVKKPQNIQQFITSDEAKIIAQSNLPYALSPTSIHIFTKNDESDYEVVFYDQQNFEYQEIEVNKLTKSISSINTEKTYDRGSQNVLIKDIDASNIVKSEFPDAQILSTELYVDDGFNVYDVTFMSSNSYGVYEINPETGSVIERDIKYGTNSVSVQLPQQQPSQMFPIGLQEAQQIALSNIPEGSIFKKLKFEYDDGVSKYEVEYINNGKKYEFGIDALTGNIINNLNYQNNAVVLPNIQQQNNTTKYIGLERAKQIALSNVPEGSIFKKLKFDYDNGFAKYEVEYINNGNEYEFDIDALTGNIINNLNQQNNAVVLPNIQQQNNAVVLPNIQQQSSPTKYIGLERAKQIALSKAPQGSVITELKLDYDDGFAKYEGEILNGRIEYSFEINAVTGALIEWDVDYDD